MIVEATLSLLLLGAGCPPFPPLLLSQSSDYGPGGDGPWFSLSVGMKPSDEVQLTSNDWILPDGTYRGQMSQSDHSLLGCLFQDLRELNLSPRMWMCPHSPDFSVITLPRNGADEFMMNVCVSQVAKSPLVGLYQFIETAVRNACWFDYRPPPAGREPRNTRSIVDLFRRSDAVAVIWMIAGVPDSPRGTFLMKGSVNWSFKGVPNNSDVYFDCRDGCTLGKRSIIFLQRKGKLGDGRSETDLHGLGPPDADYFRATAPEGYHFPVLYSPRYQSDREIVAIPDRRAILPSGIPQGRLDEGIPGLQRWADFESLKKYLISLAEWEGRLK
jgi:hypothetical protein